MQTRSGDLIALALAGEFDVIIHGCNCQHTMGAGIAKQIKAHFPAAYAADCATPKGASKLGQTSSAQADGNGHPLVIVNAYTQDNWRGNGSSPQPIPINRACGQNIRKTTTPPTQTRFPHRQGSLKPPTPVLASQLRFATQAASSKEPPPCKPVQAT